jgi:hypothetical protein
MAEVPANLSITPGPDGSRRQSHPRRRRENLSRSLPYFLRITCPSHLPNRRPGRLTDGTLCLAKMGPRRGPCGSKFGLRPRDAGRNPGGRSPPSRHEVEVSIALRPLTAPIPRAYDLRESLSERRKSDGSGATGLAASGFPTRGNGPGRPPVNSGPWRDRGSSGRLAGPLICYEEAAPLEFVGCPTTGQGLDRRVVRPPARLGLGRTMDGHRAARPGGIRLLP